MNIKHQQTNEILKWFKEISKIPRCSKNEEKIANWLIQWAKNNNFYALKDEAGNVLIKVPASPGYENSPIVIIQGHMDMVCEKTKDSTHDFSKDPIKFVFDGEWLTADKTTLGADNGIAIAMGLAMAVDKELAHPQLELLFTVDEETGLTGANALKPGFAKGKILINIDSEDEGVFTVGCAGGVNSHLTLPLISEPADANEVCVSITAEGMKGGHSGIDINAQKANAIQILALTLNSIEKQIPIRIIDIKGGSAHNAIPREAESMISLPAEQIVKLESLIKELGAQFQAEYKTIEGDLKITLSEKVNQNYPVVFNTASSKKIIRLLLALPHGVAFMSTEIKNLVETSNNLANIQIKDNHLIILTSQRSSVLSRLRNLTARIEAIAQLSGGSAKSGDGYPPWQPNMNSELLKKSTALYEKMFNKKPVVEVIHAGLECGIIGDKNPGMDMISIGPTLRYPHSPDEKVHIESIGRVWDFLVELLKSF